MIARLRSRLHCDERGVTLVEVSLTMLILSILLVMSFDFLDRTTKIAVSTDAHARVEDDVQRVLRTVTQHLRGASPIDGTCNTSGYSTSYSNCVRFSVPRNQSGFGGCARTEFVIGLVPAPAGSPSGERVLAYDRAERTTASCALGALTQQRVLLARVVNNPTTHATPQPLFRYYGADGVEINPAATPASIPKAATVTVNLQVRYQAGLSPIAMTSAAALRNNITR